MINPEQLIYDLQSQVIRLESELEQSQKDVEDFEKLALTWKEAYYDLEKRSSIKIGNLEVTIKQLEDELKTKDMT